MNSIFLNTYINKTMSMNNFIHFGCWNNLNPDKGCLINVMKLLKERLKDIDKPNIDFLTIAGDNYYPKKKKVEGKKKKIIIPELLNQGFEYLPREIPIYMILGNHDLETNIGKGNFFINNLDNPVSKNDCSVIEYEQISKNNNENIEYNLFKEMMLENGTLIIMIDTSMYSVDVNEYLPCYEFFLQGEIANYTIEELRAYQLSLIIKTITKYKDVGINNLILIGHHPIIGLKIKDGNDTRINDIIEFDNVLKEIYSILEDKVNYFYLCADVHLYQEGNIVTKIDDIPTMKIQQYIVGTGGTELDTCVGESNIGEKIENERLTYTMTRCQERCGFLECINTSPIPRFLFNEIPIEGGKRKRRKTKKRKTKRKTRKRKSRKRRSKIKTRKRKTRKTRT